jgi:alpha-1,2-mannosyltransferase
MGGVDCSVETKGTYMEAVPHASVRPEALNRAAIGLALILLLGIPLCSANFRAERGPNGDPFAGDFAHEYLGGTIVLHGDRTRFYELDYGYALQHDPAVMGTTVGENHFLPIIYPPFYYLLTAPLACLPFETAAVVWLLLMAACLGMTVWLLARAYPEHPALPAWALAGALFFVPLLEDLCSSQKGTLILLIMTAVFLLLDRRRSFWAGLVFGLLAFKPQLTLVIGAAMLCKRDWRFVLGGAATGVVLVCLSLLVGLDASEQYLHMSREMADFINKAGFPLTKMHCWYGFFKIVLPGQDATVIQAATLLVGAVTVAVLARLLWGPFDYGRPTFALQFAGLVVATVLLSPHLLTYDLTVLLLPFFLLTHLMLAHQSLFGGRHLVVAWIMVLLYAVAGVSAGQVRHTHVQITVPLLFALLAMLAWLPRRTQMTTGRK